MKSGLNSRCNGERAPWQINALLSGRINIQSSFAYASVDEKEVVLLPVALRWKPGSRVLPPGLSTIY
jgi:hypothetical protein